MRRVQDTGDSAPPTLVERIRLHKSALTAKDLAELLGCTVRNIHMAAKKGKIPSYRVGGSVRFDPVETAEWLATCKVA
jgi:excisionase family DNA binding protein